MSDTISFRRRNNEPMRRGPGGRFRFFLAVLSVIAVYASIFFALAYFFSQP